MEEREPGDDLLSQLPSDVLVFILEKVSLRDAVRAGVLSRRWRDLPSQIPRLVLNVIDFLPDDGEDGGDEHDAGGGSGDILAEASNAMQEAATALLASRAAAGAPPCTVVMRILLTGNYMSLGRLLDDAVTTGKVRGAVLKVSGSAHLLSTASALVRYGRRFKKLLGRCPAAFGCLTRLNLTNVGFHRVHDLGKILSTCTKLETLSMSSCRVFARLQEEGMWRLRHARLNDLGIFNCSGFDGRLVLEWLPRLERFDYEDWDSADTQRQSLLSFDHVPRLKTLAMSNTLLRSRRVVRLSEVLANTAVSNLRLNFKGQNIWVKPETAKRFNNEIFHNLEKLRIRNVHQECGLTWTLFLLQAAPNLKRLRVKLWDHECDAPNGSNIIPIKKKNVPWDVPVELKHYNLSRVTIQGFYNTGQEGLVTFLRTLVQAAANLKEIHIRENGACKECGVTAGIGPSFPWRDRDKDKLRESISGGGSTTFKICLPYRTKRF